MDFGNCLSLSITQWELQCILLNKMKTEYAFRKNLLISRIMHVLFHKVQGKQSQLIASNIPMVTCEKYKSDKKTVHCTKKIEKKLFMFSCDHIH
mmetsp:Transcript_9676/g.21504  ORF Transcript_9676/g.21504 Transcript_9676/m.21504 type:complete len:94 (-) Transcript_9676:1470-1751(-)